ncbi:DUF1232 domain-containing protein [Noviherbaspirillum cavernae]|uniref:DUF1232 domain-containing protein n=1 Tax=Noviherbaspirillum cavernae TaxID=2320862 RepID=A0A418X0P1_9BURK|nr:DUF1232 domain-containing protein [Noviherbaspirillum cavernae]RJG06067.1 DUF1232 domain-containing protein [Noviherbaspirillum cavernae]
MFLRLLRLLRFVGRDAVVLWYACRNPATPTFLKAGAILLVLYAIFPIDMLPDWIPVIGWADDVTLLALAIPAILKRIPPRVLGDAQAAAGGWLSRLRLRPGKS